MHRLVWERRQDSSEPWTPVERQLHVLAETPDPADQRWGRGLEIGEVPVMVHPVTRGRIFAFQHLSLPFSLLAQPIPLGPA